MSVKPVLLVIAFSKGVPSRTHDKLKCVELCPVYCCWSYRLLANHSTGQLNILTVTVASNQNNPPISAETATISAIHLNAFPEAESASLFPNISNWLDRKLELSQTRPRLL